MSKAIPVIVCDDSLLARKQMAKALHGWNVEINFAENGLQALDMIRSGLGDLLFLDLNMPVMDGYETLAQIRREDLPTLVIVVSGDVQEEARRTVLQLGALEFINKPTSPETVADVLKQFGLLSELEHPPAATQEDSLLALPDYYQEIANIAMGQAGKMLAGLLNTFIHLPIPKANVVTPQELDLILLGATQNSRQLISQGFIGGGIAGEALLTLRAKDISQVAALLGHDKTLDHPETELMMALSNALIGAFLTSFSRQINLGFSLSSPQIIHDFKALPERNQNWERTLVITIDYELSEHDIECDLMLAFTADSLNKLQQLTEYFS